RGPLPRGGKPRAEPGVERPRGGGGHGLGLPDPHGLHGQAAGHRISERSQRRSADRGREAMTRATLGLLIGTAVAASLACGKGDHSLDGSLSEVFDLDVSTVHVLRNDDALVVSYEHNAGRDIDLVLRFTLALDQLTLKTGRTVNIAGATDAGTLRAT